MNIKSCENCGVVIDTDRLFFPLNIYGDDGAVDENLATYNGEEYVPHILCPICDTPITEE